MGSEKLTAFLPLNYTAQAEASLRLMITRLETTEGKADQAEVLKNVLWIFDKLTPFSLPSEGVLFNDNLKGLRSLPAHPSYPGLSLEYVREGSPYVCVVRELPASGVLGLISNLPSDQVWRFSSVDTVLALFTFLKTESLNVWAPVSSVALVSPPHWESGREGFFTCGVDYFEKFYKNIPENVKAAGWKAAVNAVNVYLGFCEALACKNVKATTYQKACPKNAKRVKAGKLPIYETKILTLACPSNSYNRSVRDTTNRASPIQHLRRGHIRRLDGELIWVNSCVVGSSSVGVLAKDYEVNPTWFYKSLREAKT